MSDVKDTVIVKLSESEALVIFEMLARRKENAPVVPRDGAEEIALNNLCSLFESILTAPLDPDYRTTLQRAKEALRDRYG